MRISQAVKVVFPSGGATVALGRIWEFDGGIAIVRTPHGSELRAGRLWVRPLDSAERAALKGFEEHAATVGMDYSKKDRT